jgi:hypothetical protein
MLEMKVVLRAVLSRAEVRSGLEGPELTRRRSITVSPRHGAVTALRERASVRRLSPTRTPAAPSLAAHEVAEPRPGEVHEPKGDPLGRLVGMVEPPAGERLGGHQRVGERIGGSDPRRLEAFGGRGLAQELGDEAGELPAQAGRLGREGPVAARASPNRTLQLPRCSATKVKKASGPCHSCSSGGASASASASASNLGARPLTLTAAAARGAACRAATGCEVGCSASKAATTGRYGRPSCV